jgi:hypothetical protein
MKGLSRVAIPWIKRSRVGYRSPAGSEFKRIMSRLLLCHPLNPLPPPPRSWFEGGPSLGELRQHERVQSSLLSSLRQGQPQGQPRRHPITPVSCFRSPFAPLAMSTQKFAFLNHLQNKDLGNCENITRSNRKICEITYSFVFRTSNKSSLI